MVQFSFRAKKASGTIDHNIEQKTDRGSFNHHCHVLIAIGFGSRLL